MKALYMAGPGVFDLREIDQPTPGPGDVLIAVRLVGVCGSDRHYLEEDYAHDFAASPLIPGHEAAGEVVEVGAGVERVKVGDRVAIEPARPCRQCETCRTGYGNSCPDVAFLGFPPDDGLLREFIAYPADGVAVDRTGASYEDLTMLEPLAIVVNCVDVVGFRVGWSALVVGCGAIGLTTIAVLRAMGASKIVATDVLDYKRDWALRYGADLYLNPDRDGVTAAVLEATEGRGVDVSFECAGAIPAQNQALWPVKPAGALAVVGINSENRLELDASFLRRHGVTIHNIRRSNETLERAMSLAEKSDLRLGEMITHRYALEDTPKAFENFMAYGDDVIKAGIEPKRTEN